MELFTVDALFVWAVIVGVGIILAPVVQVAWTMRILIASYVSLSLVLFMPQLMVFDDYAKAVYFGVITILFALIEKGRFFSVSEWSVGRFSPQAFGISVFLWFFIFSVMCYLLPFGYMDSFMNREVYDLLKMHVFYFALAPLIFTILFSRYLR
jgi:hypothetical protein